MIKAGERGLAMKLILMGDVNLMGVTNPEEPFRKILGELHAADVVFGNLECCPPPPGFTSLGGGVPIREIARRIGVAASTVRVTLKRAKIATGQIPDVIPTPESEGKDPTCGYDYTQRRAEGL